jgi:GT2 family glycosyltransferase
LEDYAAWRGKRIRALDLDGLDVPRSDWQAGPHIRLIARWCAGAEASLRNLLSQLQNQPYPLWTLVIQVSSDDIDAFKGMDDCGTGNLIALKANGSQPELLNGLADLDLIVPVDIDDEILDYALAVLAETSMRCPAADVFYGDEDIHDAFDHAAALRLRPDWSPYFYSRSHFRNVAAFMRVKVVRQFLADSTNSGDKLFDDIYPDSGAAVQHIRRVMRRRRTRPEEVKELRAPRFTYGPLDADEGSTPFATIIIPTRDRVQLLKRCVDSLKERTSIRNLEIIIIDNGSIEPDTLKFFAEVKEDRRFRVIPHAGPFNFAKLCNAAAREATSSNLVFVNNDTEIIEDHWLEPLIHWAGKADVGAAGAKLLYPSGEVQHAGVVLGIDGRAAHFERMSNKNDPGYFGRLCVPHEVSAVTAACMAIEKWKFDAVDGFDELNLPVELNDIDLCLRLSEKGWKSICVTDSVLIHHEAASRGTTWRPDAIYKDEHVYFRKRWMHRLRDDPYFHPALSLHALGPALG